MAGFESADSARPSSTNPRDRRFHAQPNACPVCGPSARLLDAAGGVLPHYGSRDAVEAAANALLAGAIVAIKGLGGFHLACRRDDEQAVASLRARKRREDRPFALMAPDLESARRWSGRACSTRRC